MKTHILALSLTAAALAGCASIMTEPTQSIGVEVLSASGEKLSGASCSAINDKGMWTIEAPGVVVVRKSAEDLMVRCTKAGQEVGVVRAISRANPAMIGNLAIGAFPALVDHTKGTGYTYPSWMQVKMGTSATFDAMDTRSRPQVMASEEASPAESRVADSDAPAATGQVAALR